MPGMDIGADDLFHLREHLNQFKRMQCPVCEEQNWSFVGMGGIWSMPDGKALNSSGSVPTYVLICRRCHYVRQFAALPIRREATEGTKDVEDV